MYDALCAPFAAGRHKKFLVVRFIAHVLLMVICCSLSAGERANEFLYIDESSDLPGQTFQIQALAPAFGTHAAHPPPSSHPYDLTVVGPFCIYGSISKQAVELIQALKQDLSISFIPTSQLMDLGQVSQDVQRIITTPGYLYKGKALIVEDRMVEVPQGGLFERFGLPKADEHQLRFVYDMCETSRISSKWAQLLNLYDAVLVPDEFLVPCYIASGVTAPIFVLPLGIYMDDFYSIELPNRHNSHPFVFANFGHLCERKDQLLLIQAFSKAFGNNPDVKLWLATRYAHKDYEQKVLDEIHKRGLTNIVYERTCDKRASYLRRYRFIDCYVNIAQGEGFSIQPREAMFFGIPVIVSDNTAHHTICKSGLVRPVPATIETPSPDPEFGHYLRCCVDDVAQALQEIYATHSHRQHSLYPSFTLNKATSVKLWPLPFFAFKNCPYQDSFPFPLSAGIVDGSKGRPNKAVMQQTGSNPLLNNRLQQARRWAQQYDYKNLRPLYLSILSPKRIVLGHENCIRSEEICTTSKALYSKMVTIFPNVCAIDRSDGR